MAKPSNECPACGDQGWTLCNSGNDQSPDCEIQRCDACERFDNDLAALQAVVSAAESLPALRRFVEAIANLTHEGEPGTEGEPYEPASEDAISTLNGLIAEARELTGVARECSECGQSATYLLNCPDGTELCQDCFDTTLY